MPEDELTLSQLNAAVDEAIERRRDWLDKEMLATASLKVGDEIYDLEKGLRLGVVSKLYRYWRDRDEGVRDRYISVEYEYKTRPGCFDNTSCQPGLRHGTRQEAADALKWRAEWLQNAPPNHPA